MALIEKLSAIADAIRGKTAKTEPLTLDQMAVEIAGIEIGGCFPEKFYETDFVVDESFTANGAICTISTGLSTDIIVPGSEIVVAAITCEPSATPETWVGKQFQFMGNNQNAAISVPVLAFYLQNNVTPKSTTSAVGAYIQSAAKDLSTLTIYGRFNACPPAPGTYHLELYRTGFAL